MRTVVVAEHHLPTADLLAQTLAGAGWRVVRADDAAGALERCVSERPDAVVIAADLPRHQGATLGQLLRATEVGARLPLLAVDKGHLGRARGVAAVLDLMVNAYLPDATGRAELLARLDRLVGSPDHAPPPTGIAATLSRTPVVVAELRARTLPSHVKGWHRLGRDGILVLTRGESSRRVFFLRGSPVHCDSTEPRDTLPGWMLSRGLLSEQVHAEVLAIMGSNGLSAGAALVALGTSEPGEPLMTLLRQWARAQLVETYAASEGRFSFYAGAEFAEEVPTLELPALGPLYEAARLSWPTGAFVTALTPRLADYPTRSVEFARELPSLGLGGADLKMTLAVDGAHTLREQLVGSSDLRRALALFWYLATVEALTFAKEPTALGAGQPPRPAPRRRLPLPEEKAAELREEAIRILTGSFFRMLGLDITADAEAVERAYRAAATRFDPDGWATYELGPLGELLAPVQEKLSAAHRVLSNAERRKAYLGYLLPRAGAVRAAPLNVEAEVELKRGEGLMLRGDWTGASAAFERASELNPREPEYYSYRAWAVFRTGPGELAERARAALKLVRKALSLDSGVERPQVIAAIIEDEVGDPAEARRMLLKVLRANPDPPLAKHVLQLLSRRRGSGEKP